MLPAAIPARCAAMFRDEPFATLPVGARRTLGALALVSSVALTLALGAIDLALRNPSCPNGIVTFELAGSLPAAEAILASWDAQARVYAGLSLGLDYAYLVAYSTALAFVCAWASRRAVGVWAAVGRWLCWGQWLAAVLDGCENFGLIRLLLGSRWALWPVFATGCALGKFTLLIAGALYIAGAALRPRA
jgi:hypothetical protein